MQFEDKSKVEKYAAGKDEFTLAGESDDGSAEHYDIGSCTDDYPTDFEEIKGE